ncbi:MAG: hypothetical protein AB1445_05730 [Bacillota bacterium]
MNDSVATGIVSGTLGAAAHLVFSWLAQAAGISRTTLLRVAAAVVLRNAPPMGPITIITGVTSHFVIGAVFGVGLAWLMAGTGRDWAVVKGLAYGAFLWLVPYSLITPFFVPDVIVRPDAPSALVLLASHLVYGYVTVRTALALRFSTR